jgi:nucleoside-diphosphate-sugar epimerase
MPTDSVERRVGRTLKNESSVRRICLFGAGGPVGAAAAAALRDRYVLRLTDVRPIAEIAREARPQSPGAPLPVPLGPPHECRVVDVADYAQVLEAARDADILINLTVVRDDPALAFRVNLVGAYHVARAARALGIRRLIHTGPVFWQPGHEADYWYDFDVPDEAPVHAGTGLYLVTKALAEAAMRVMAEAPGLEILSLRFSSFRPGDGEDDMDNGVLRTCTVSWADTGRAFLRAVEAPEMPRRYEPFQICAPLPLGKYAPAKAERLLGWRARDTFGRLYRRGH